jgi:hypothetical protein
MGFPTTVSPIVHVLRERIINADTAFPGSLAHYRWDINISMREGIDYHIVDELTETDNVMNNTLWVGIYSGLTGNKSK